VATRGQREKEKGKKELRFLRRVKEHKSWEDAWIGFRGGGFDITPFMKSHGNDTLAEFTGNGSRSKRDEKTTKSSLHLTNEIINYQLFLELINRGARKLISN